VNKKQAIVIASYFIWLIIIAVIILASPVRTRFLVNHLLLSLALPGFFGLLLWHFLK